MDTGFVEARSDNLPRIDGLMIACYFASNPNFVSAELRNVKTARAGRESYRDDDVGYVQLKREYSICVVKGKITPEHKVSKKPYTVHLKINETDNVIEELIRNDCVGSQGGCKHVIAFLMWVHRRCKEPSPTEIACYWKKSKLSKVGTSLKIISIAEIGSKTFKPLDATNGEFLNSFVEYSNKLGVKMQITEYLPEVFEEVEGATKDQAHSDLWHELRYGRVTASKAYEVAHCKTFEGSLVEAILGGRKLKDSEAMKRGRELEDLVFKTIEKEITC